MLTLPTPGPAIGLALLTGVFSGDCMSARQKEPLKGQLFPYNYTWIIPASVRHQSVEASFLQQACGIKQLYYLNTVLIAIGISLRPYLCSPVFTNTHKWSF